MIFSCATRACRLLVLRRNIAGALKKSVILKKSVCYEDVAF